MDFICVRAVSLLLCLCLPFVSLLSVSRIAAADAFANAKEADGKVFLEYRDNGDGEIEAVLKLESEAGIAALACEMAYDSNVLLYLGCGEGEGGMTLTARDMGECVRFLLDGAQNSPSQCTLASFYFKRISTDAAMLSLSSMGDKCSFYFDGQGELKQLAASLSGCLIGGGSAEDTSESDYSPRLLNFELIRYEERAEVSFEVTAEDGFFAAGVKLFVLDIKRGTYDTVYAVGVAQNGSFSGKCALPFRADAELSVVITPVAFDRIGTVFGEKLTSISLTDDKIPRLFQKEKN